MKNLTLKKIFVVMMLMSAMSCIFNVILNIRMQYSDTFDVVMMKITMNHPITFWAIIAVVCLFITWYIDREKKK